MSSQISSCYKVSVLNIYFYIQAWVPGEQEVEQFNDTRLPEPSVGVWGLPGSVPGKEDDISLPGQLCFTVRIGLGVRAGPGPLATTRSSSITASSTLTSENTETSQRALGRDQLEIVFSFQKINILRRHCFYLLSQPQWNSKVSLQYSGGMSI